MSVTILIPTALRSYAGGERAVQVAGSTVREALDTLTTRHDGLARHLRTAVVMMRSLVNVLLYEVYIM